MGQEGEQIDYSHEARDIQADESTLLAKADKAALTLIAPRYKKSLDTSTGGLYRGADESLQLARDNPTLLADLATGWQIAFPRFTEFHNSINKQKTEPGKIDHWNNISETLYQPFRILLSAPIPEKRWREPEPLTDDEMSACQTQAYGLLEDLLASPDFSAHQALTAMTQYDLWFAWKQYSDAATSTIKNGPAIQQFKAIYDKKRHLTLPILQKATLVAAQTGNTNELSEIIDGLHDTEDKEGATTLLLQSGLTAEQRTQMAIAYANTFGFIPTIDTITQALQNSEDVELNEQLKKIYETFQGEELTQIMHDLSEVYKNVDFHEYALNSTELTEKEAAMLDEMIKAVMAKKGIINPKDFSIIDIGAGTGRLSLALKAKGFTDLTAFEYEQHHVDKIREQDPELAVIQGDWSKLAEAVGHKDFAYSLGRTISHNRTPGAMLNFFDQVQQITGEFVFDQPNVDWGVYRNRIEHLKNTLAKIGIKAPQEGAIFDGPDQEHQFNRMVLRPEQVDAFAFLTGFRRITDVQHNQVGEDIDNLYYHLEKDPEFDPTKLDKEQVRNAITTLGLAKIDADFNQYVQAWGMTLGQVLVYGLDNQYIRDANRVGWGPKVTAITAPDGVVMLESTPAPRRQ